MLGLDDERGDRRKGQHSSGGDEEAHGQIMVNDSAECRQVCVFSSSYSFLVTKNSGFHEKKPDGELGYELVYMASVPVLQNNA